MYTPAKLLLAGTGAVLSLFAAPVSDASASIYTASVHGDYLLTPEQVACDEGPEFFGRQQPEVDGAMAGEAVDAPANDAEATAKDAEVTENDDDATEEGVDRSENAPSAGDTQPQT